MPPVDSVGGQRSPEDHHRRLGGSELSEDGPEIGVRRDEDSTLVAGTVEDLSVRGLLHPQVADVDDVVPMLDENLANLGRKALVDEEPHAPGRRGNSRSRTASAA